MPPAMADREEQVLEWIVHHGRVVVPVARGASLLGDTPVVWLAVTGTAVGAAIRQGRWAALYRPVSILALTAGTRRALAETIGRARPPRRLWRAHWSGPSWPSRHTTSATLGAGLIAEILGGPPAHRAACLVAVAVGVSRLVLGVHWPTDVLAGWVFAGTALVLARKGRDPDGTR